MCCIKNDDLSINYDDFPINYDDFRIDYDNFRICYDKLLSFLASIGYSEIESML